MPPYGAWTQHSAREWPRLAAELLRETGIDVALRAGGRPARLPVAAGTRRACRALGAAVRATGLRALSASRSSTTPASPRACRGLGPDVAGGTLLRTRRRLQSAAAAACAARGVARAGAAYLAEHAVDADRARRRALHAATPGAKRSNASASCSRRDSATRTLAPMVGLPAPVTPNKGQIIVLERVPPFLPFPLERSGRPTKAPC